MILRIKNIVTSLIVLWGIIGLWFFLPILSAKMTGSYVLFGWRFSYQEAILSIAGIYSIVIALIHLVSPASKSDALTVFEHFFLKKHSEDTAKILRIFFLKGFFVPLLLSWTLSNVAAIYNYLPQISSSAFYSFPEILPKILVLFYAIDVGTFLIAYLFEHPIFRNTIVSIDGTWSGWIICLACYEPWNSLTTNWLGWRSGWLESVLPIWGWAFFGTLLVIFMGIYVWATIALGMRSGNLVNRGVVHRGPYRFVRHPAYISKNIAWWIGGIPFLMGAADIKTIAIILVSLVGWSGIYALRAITEERHLLLANNGYKEYCKKVPYRFIPGVF